MAPTGARYRVHSFAASLLLLVGLGMTVRAQEDIYYSRQTTFRIPFQIDLNDRRVVQVILHVSEDLGRTYQQVTTAGPGDKGFTFTAKRDGWYYFTVQTMDNERRLFPTSVDGSLPGLRVLVDTVAPSIKIKALNNLKPGQVGLEWDIRDESLDPNSLRLEYRSPGQLWQDRVVQKAAYGTTSWDPGVAGPIEVRLQIKDRAGNLGEATERISGGIGGKPMDRVDEPPMQPQPRNDDPSAIRKINSKRISLNYKIDDVGPSDVAAVEIWKTRDGRLWQRHPQDADKRPPFIIEVEGEGRYGFTLVAKSGVGLGEGAPRPGDQPQIWVEVDLTKPDVRVVETNVGRGLETGNLTITWSATDRNLARQGISLLYSTKAEGPWTAIPGATTLENTGRFIWRMAADVPYEFFIRVEAADEAGNIGQADTQRSIKVDLSLPKARVIGVEPAKPQNPD